MSHVLIAEARFYPALSDALLAGAVAALEAAGATFETVQVPGALEIPGVIALAGASGRFQAYVALGVVIRGETYHFEVVANESARAIMDLTLRGIAVGNGVLTVESEAQAWARARVDEGDKGGGAARAALALMGVGERFRSSSPA